jgi:hypothetical protein
MASLGRNHTGSELNICLLYNLLHPDLSNIARAIWFELSRQNEASIAYTRPLITLELSLLRGLEWFNTRLHISSSGKRRSNRAARSVALVSLFHQARNSCEIVQYGSARVCYRRPFFHAHDHRSQAIMIIPSGSEGMRNLYHPLLSERASSP